MISLSAEQKTIEGIFGSPNETCVIPVYQRPYSWGFDQLYELYRDLKGAYNEDESYFLGNIILARSKAYRNDGKRSVVDGYKVEVLNGQNFVFSITYADDPENDGKTGEMSVKNVGKIDEMSVNNDGKGVSAKEKRNRRHQAIISLIRENADISQVKMASRLEVSTKTIERDLEELERAGVVRYDGEKNSGQWVLLKERVDGIRQE